MSLRAWGVCAAVACALVACQGQTIQAYPDELAGIGVVVQITPDGHTITKVVAEGPAATAGLEEGDRILAVNGRLTTGEPLASVIQSLRGKAGTSVTVRTSGRKGEVTSVLQRRLLARAGSSGYRTN